MPGAQKSTINLGLSQTPEVADPRLFPEFVRLYNAINLLAQYLDQYTVDGTLGSAAGSQQQQINAITKVLDQIGVNPAMSLYIKDSVILPAGVATLQGLVTPVGKKRTITSMLAVNSTAAAITLKVYALPVTGTANTNTLILNKSVIAGDSYDCAPLIRYGMNSGVGIYAEGAGLSFGFSANDIPN